MNEFFTQFKNKARADKLSQSEKQSMRVRLYTYFEQNPIGSISLPQKAQRPVPSPYFFFSPRYMVPVVILLIVSLGTGTAFAAQSALPGQPLYAVKININEPVQVALATTPEAKAEVNASIATTRLEEAETLASTGNLSASTTAELATNFTEHAAAAQASTDALEPADPGAAAQLGAEFDSTLAAHGAILTQLGDDSSSTETMQNSDALVLQVTQAEQGDDTALAIGNPPTPALAVNTAANASAQLRPLSTFAPRANHPMLSTAAASSGTSTPSQNPAVAISLGAEASTSIATLVQDFAALQPQLDATTSAEASAQVQNIQAQYAAGNFSGALRLSVRLDAYLKAGKQFNVRLLNGLLNSTVHKPFMPRTNGRS